MLNSTYLTFRNKLKKNHTVGPASKEVPESAIAEHSFSQKPVKQRMLISD